MVNAMQKTRLDRWLPYLLIFAGVVGVIAAFVITQDKFQLAANPNFKPSCSLNPVVSCGSVMKSMQSHVFGFSNTYAGLIGFPVLITTGVVMLGGAVLRRWYYLGLNAGMLFGVGFVHYLFFQSVYRIHALCPYCMAVWVVTITTFWYVTLYNIQHGHLKLPPRLQPIGYFMRRSTAPTSQSTIPCRSLTAF